MATKTSGNFPKKHEKMCKVRFEGAATSAGQQQQQDESPRSRWRRFGRLSLLRQCSRNDRAQPMQIQKMPTTMHVGMAVNTSEEESSSNSTPNLTEHRLSMQSEMATTSRSTSQPGNDSSYLTMQHSSSASTSPATGPTTNDGGKQSKKRGDRESPGKSCLFGAFHVETGARLFLLFYILLSACGVALGSVATMVWILVPLVVIPMAAYSLSKNASKYLYPFLIISIIHSIVAFLMVLIVGSFSLLCFDQLKTHFAESMKAFPSSGTFPSSSFTALCCAFTMALSLGLSLFFFWQSLVLFSCINHFDIISQHQQQIQQQQAKESKQFQSMVSFPLPAALEQRQHMGGPSAQIVSSRQLECSQCISEIRQSGQFNNGEQSLALNQN